MNRKVSALAHLRASQDYCNLFKRITFNRYWEPLITRRNPSLKIDPTVRWSMGCMIGKATFRLASSTKQLNSWQVGGEMWLMLRPAGASEEMLKKGTEVA